MADQKNRVLLAGNGDFPSPKFLKDLVKSADKIIGIDGGADRLQLHDVIPNIIIGDMDSISAKYIADFSGEIYTVKSQEETDLVKGLNWCYTQGYDSVDIIGIEGGRVDHQLAAFAAICEVPNMDAVLHFNDYLAQRLTENWETELQLGTQISLFAFGTVRNLSLFGFQYELNNEKLTFCSKGVSNRTTSKKIAITHNSEDGYLVILIKR